MTAEIKKMLEPVVFEAAIMHRNDFRDVVSLEDFNKLKRLFEKSNELIEIYTTNRYDDGTLEDDEVEFRVRQDMREYRAELLKATVADGE